MRTRLLAFTAALALAVLGAAVPVAQAAVPTVTGPDCVKDKGTVEYDATTGLYTCVGGPHHDGELITTT
ncbi:hypothetical protein OG429_17965 [Streptomyces sp. NBC_00190]|uniref:hypothetical protein n=1 Tax=unclassified Streptomyces TaxID=2593676 RepID=UPI002E2BEC8D|nr:hypothetical protein [Streptomyces sp. NBC_00190]WSZ40992.1 hypothetical protein OG239_20665 [Streptomyces sp. NBC_00868]